MKWDGFEMTAEDQAEHERPLQLVGHFLVGRDGVILWAPGGRPRELATSAEGRGAAGARLRRGRRRSRTESGEGAGCPRAQKGS
jgi:hypothetical protein